MNVRRYVFVKVQLVIWFQSSLSHETLATCTLLRPADCIKERITHKERRTSHFTHKEVGWFSDILLQDCLSIHSTVNGKPTANVGSIFCCHMSWDRPMCCCARVIHEFLQLVRLHFPRNTCDLHVAAPCRLHKERTTQRLTSHMKKLGDSLTCLLQDCLSIPHLS